MGNWRTTVFVVAAMAGALALASAELGSGAAVSALGVPGVSDVLGTPWAVSTALPTQWYTPNGWRLRPGGTQVLTERSPTGLAVAPGGSAVYTVSSGIFDEGIERIDATTLVGVPELVGDLWLGVVADGAGNIYASGGADRPEAFPRKRFSGTTVDHERCLHCCRGPVSRHRPVPLRVAWEILGDPGRAPRGGRDRPPPRQTPTSATPLQRAIAGHRTSPETSVPGRAGALIVPRRVRTTSV